jgi:hypothetical protein
MFAQLKLPADEHCKSPVEPDTEEENSLHPSPYPSAAPCFVTRGSATNSECANALATASACNLCDSLREWEYY